MFGSMRFADAEPIYKHTMDKARINMELVKIPRTDGGLSYGFIHTYRDDYDVIVVWHEPGRGKMTKSVEIGTFLRLNPELYAGENRKDYPILPYAKGATFNEVFVDEEHLETYVHRGRHRETHWLDWYVYDEVDNCREPYMSRDTWSKFWTSGNRCTKVALDKSDVRNIAGGRATPMKDDGI